MENELTARLSEAIMLYRDLSLAHWLSYELFTWQWWVNLAATLLPLLAWWKLVDKQRLLRIAFFGAVVNLTASSLDVVGSSLHLWEYPIRILPIPPLLYPVDFVFVPLLLMLVYQKYPRWRDFLLATAAVATGLTFVGEPLAVYINVYKLITWRYVYSFPLYILIAVLARLVADWFWRVQHSNRN